MVLSVQPGHANIVTALWDKSFHLSRLWLIKSTAEEYARLGFDPLTAFDQALTQL